MSLFGQECYVYCQAAQNNISSLNILNAGSTISSTAMVITTQIASDHSQISPERRNNSLEKKISTV